jgi:hypothetical protein
MMSIYKHFYYFHMHGHVWESMGKYGNVWESMGKFK